MWWEVQTQSPVCWVWCVFNISLQAWSTIVVFGTYPIFFEFETTFETYLFGECNFRFLQLGIAFVLNRFNQYLGMRLSVGGSALWLLQSSSIPFHHLMLTIFIFPESQHPTPLKLMVLSTTAFFIYFYLKRNFACTKKDELVRRTFYFSWLQVCAQSKTQSKTQSHPNQQFCRPQWGLYENCGRNTW
jgi:hypothetical protein